MAKTQHDESKLPKWTQKRLNDLRAEIRRLQALEEAHMVLQERRWFTLRDSTLKERSSTKLFVLYENGAHCVCSIGKGDVLLIGRAKEGDNGE